MTDFHASETLRNAFHFFGRAAAGRSGAGRKDELSEFDSRRKQLWAELSANRRLVLGDAMAFALSIVPAMALAQGGIVLIERSAALVPILLLSALIAIAVFPLSNLYCRHLRSASLRDLVIVARGAGLAAIVLCVVSAIVPATSDIATGVFVIHFLLAVPAMGGLRLGARHRELVRRNRRLSEEQGDRVPVLLVGAGANCDLYLRSLRNTGSKSWPMGIIDDSHRTAGLYFHDVKIIGSLRDAGAVVKRLDNANVPPQRLLLTEPITHFDSDGIRRLTSWAEGRGIPVIRLAGLEDLGENSGGDDTRLRRVAPEDILDRPQMRVERTLLRSLFVGRRVLVTGAGGSIGSEMARQIASFGPAELVMIDNCEFNAYSVEMDIAQHFPGVERRVYVASIRDAVRINAIFERHRPELVFNAAALKHVPMVEANPCEGVLTNVIGTRNVADAARNVGAIAMVQVSTDKAVNSTNVMGATKRVAEFYIRAQDLVTNQTDEPMRFFAVRFGNVLGSSGSLIPLFQRQISAGGPLTVTDPAMERYFMTIREAVQLTLVAAASGLEMETTHGEIFVLDMGKPVRIVDLAERVIRLAGLVPYDDIDITFIGKRPGEKLFEELFDASEVRRDSSIPGVSFARPQGVAIPRLRAQILKLEQAARQGDEAAVIRLLKDLVPGYGGSDLRPVDVEQRSALGELLAASADKPLPGRDLERAVR